MTSMRDRLYAFVENNCPFGAQACNCQTGRSILTRLPGMLLAALSVQFDADGVKALAAG